ncbi:hypothetical protein ACFQ6N_07210 [Kitasatospora sp. NPDC056446]|uniref:hypothetical protein n=1 Tax=Kitasatospora sp. NPDC056446 TaxID=3345819 RepID=UPI0036931D26
MYQYLTVRSDERHGGSVRAGALVAYLDSVPGLRRTDAASYRAREDRPWLDVTLAACGGTGGYAVFAGRVPERVDVVELVWSSADGAPAHAAARAVAAGIADLLGWEVVDPDSDEVLYVGSAVAGAAEESGGPLPR